MPVLLERRPAGEGEASPRFQRALWGKFAVDSPLEGDGFELPVPGREAVKPSCETLSKTGADLLGTQGSNPSPSSGESHVRT
jgi:hypothetical protein